ncbi:hypothetical protein pb186bvf_006367 [Paramecium bursaria]
MNKHLIVSAKIQNQKMKEDDDVKWSQMQKNGEILLQMFACKLVADGDEMVQFTNFNTASNLNPLLEFADIFLEQYQLEVPRIIAQSKNQKEELDKMKKFKDKYFDMWEQFKSESKLSQTPLNLETIYQASGEDSVCHIDLKEKMPNLEYEFEKEQQAPPEILEIEERIKSKFCSEVKAEQLQPKIEKYSFHDPKEGFVERERIVFPGLKEYNFQNIFQQESAKSQKSKRSSNCFVPRLSECNQQIKNELQLQTPPHTPPPRRGRWSDTAEDNYVPTEYGSNETSNNKPHTLEWRPDPEYDRKLKEGLRQPMLNQSEEHSDYSINDSPKKDKRLFQNGKIVPKWAESIQKLRNKKKEQRSVDYYSIFGNQSKPTIIRNEFFKEVRGSSSKWIISSQPQEKENKFNLSKHLLIPENFEKKLKNHKFMTQTKDPLGASQSPYQQAPQIKKPNLGGVGGIVNSFKKIFNKFSSNKKAFIK